MSKIRLVKAAKTAFPIVRNAAIGAVAGWSAGHSVADANGAPAGRKRGAEVGATVGAVTGLPFGKIARKVQLMSRTYSAGLRAVNPGSRAVKAIGAVDRGYTKSRVVFRRVRGRIVPIFGGK